jgi:hypothetical protein
MQNFLAVCQHLRLKVGCAGAEQSEICVHARLQRAFSPSSLLLLLLLLLSSASSSASSVSFSFSSFSSFSSSPSFFPFPFPFPFPYRHLFPIIIGRMIGGVSAPFFRRSNPRSFLAGQHAHGCTGRCRRRTNVNIGVTDLEVEQLRKHF